MTLGLSMVMQVNSAASMKQKGVSADNQVNSWSGRLDNERFMNSFEI